MANVDVKVSDFVPDLVSTLSQGGGLENFPNLMESLNAAAYWIEAVWKKVAMEQRIGGRGGDYVRSIKTDVDSADNKFIFSDMEDPASPRDMTTAIEEGHGPIDLKPGLLAGPKARSGRTGAYNIVPFRHGVPGTLASNRPMPINVYRFILKATKDAVAQGLQGKSITTGFNKTTGRAKYNWGVRVPESKGGAPETRVKGREKFGAYTWKTGKYTHMVRMQTSTTKAQSSKYLTFRTVSTRSDPASWIVPSKAGFPIRETVLKYALPTVVKMIQDALSKDLQ